MGNAKFLVMALLVSGGSFVHASGVEAVPSELDLIAANAKTPQEHAIAAKGFREQAEKFEAKAAKHSMEVDRLRRSGAEPVELKWRHVRGDPVSRERKLVADAKRAADEARERSNRHAQMAVELGFSDDSSKTAK
jgi:hypothetical protein